MLKVDILHKFLPGRKTGDDVGTANVVSTEIFRGVAH